MALAAFGLLTWPTTGATQEVVQQLPNPASVTLNEALRRLSRSPTSLPALLDAGRSSLELNDTDAAEGFFLRAAAVAPNDGAVLTGLALVAVRQVDPHTALRLFEQARAAGENLDPHAADHGLAYDLVGRNAEAQERYGVALSRGGNVEVERRLALSYAIGGDQDASEATLLPLLQRRDVAAYRTRAFALAILGREEEAVSIAEVMLPARIARRMDPYLRNMRQLTPSQQAAAANLGVFPTNGEEGREPVQLTRSMDLTAPPAQSGQSDSRLIPGGEPLGPVARAPSEQVPVVQSRLAETTIAQAQVELPALVQQAEVFAPPPAVPEPVVPEVAVAVPEEVIGPSFSIAEPAALPARTPEPAPEPEPEPEPISLAEAFASFDLPPADPPVRAAPGAVDITAIVPVREVRRPPPPPPSPPPPPPHPSRHWVQVATGQDVAAFRFDWRRLVREADGALAGRQPYRARWGQTNRLMTGPFASTREANAFVTELSEKGIDAFRFTSAAGEEVLALP
ncbi:MAG TPA: tetratricopeptide repeat protein [Paracoccaceae bacterium]|nr:tetratricopeptide repeat protein [Paracoccaceae bacterium]